MKFIKFIGVGGVATAIQYILLVLLVELTSTNIVLLSAFSFLVSAVFNYLMNYYFTFESDAKHGVATIKFALVASCGLLLNTAIMHLMVEMQNIHYIVSQVSATIVVLFWNFFIHKYWTYNTGQLK